MTSVRRRTTLDNELEENSMNSMKKLLVPMLAALMSMTLVIPAFAQDATATPDASGSTGSTDTTMQGTGTLSCDSSTILLAGLAQRYFGYAPTDVTLGTYAYGQYSPLFDMSTMSTTGSTDSTGMTGEATADASGSTSGDVSANPTLAPSTVLLNPPVISGEDPACTQLRTSLESFFSTQLQSGNWDSNFRNGMSGTGASG
jgi:hypothetical protein